MTRMLALVALVAHAAPTAPEAPARGACAYSTDDAAKKHLAFCTHVASDEACRAEASRKASAEWLEKHPAKFSPGADCTASDKKFRKGAKKAVVRADGSKANARQ